MTAGKTLNTSNTLYPNIIRALSGDEVKSKLVALDGGADTITQPYHVSEWYPSTATFTAKQGIARNDTHWFAMNSGVGTSSLKKYDLSSVEVESNADPYIGLPSGIDHVGDGFLYGSFLYVAMSNYSSGISTVKCIAKYNISDLTLDSYIDLNALTDLNCSGCCLSDNGQEILVTSYYNSELDDPRNRDIYRIDISTELYLGVRTLSQPCGGIQGIVFHEGNYYLSSYILTGNINRIYVYDDTFSFLTSSDPANSNNEMEGLESYGGDLYFHTLNGPPLIYSPAAMWITTSTTNSDPAQFLDNSLMSDECTILINCNPKTLFNFNTLIDNQTNANNWESWLYASGEFAWRVNSAARTSIFGITANTEYLLALTWDNNAGTVTAKAGVNGVYGAPVSTAWITPPAGGMWLGGVNAGNDQADIVFRDVLVFDKVLSDAELLDSYNNFDDFYVKDGEANLNVDNILSSQVITQTTLSTGSQLTTDNITNSQLLSSADLSQGYVLTVDGLLSQQLLSEVLLTQANILSVEGLSSNQSLTNVALTVAGGLSVQSLLNSQDLSEPLLTQQNQLNVNGLLNNQTLSASELIQGFLLSVDDISSNQELTSPLLDVDGSLSVQSLVSYQTISEPTITQHIALITNNLTQEQFIGNVRLNEEDQTIGTVTAAFKADYFTVKYKD